MTKRIQEIIIQTSKLAGMAFLLLALLSPLSVAADQSQSPSMAITEPEHLANKTIRVRSVASGYGILHTSHDGTAYLWFPGKTRLINGVWYDQQLGLVQKSEAGEVRFHHICFDYLDMQRQTIGKDSFKSLECFWLHQFVALIAEVENGDLLDLASGRVPCRLCRNDASLAQLKAKVRN